MEDFFNIYCVYSGTRRYRRRAEIERHFALLYERYSGSKGYYSYLFSSCVSAGISQVPKGFSRDGTNSVGKIACFLSDTKG